MTAKEKKEKKLIEEYYELFDKVKKLVIALAKEKCFNVNIEYPIGYFDYSIKTTHSVTKFTEIEIKNQNYYVLKNGIIYNLDLICQILSQ